MCLGAHLFSYILHYFNIICILLLSLHFMMCLMLHMKLMY